MGLKPIACVCVGCLDLGCEPVHVVVCTGQPDDAAAGIGIADQVRHAACGRPRLAGAFRAGKPQQAGRFGSSNSSGGKQGAGGSAGGGQAAAVRQSVADIVALWIAVVSSLCRLRVCVDEHLELAQIF